MEEIDTHIEVTSGANEEPRIQTERPGRSTKVLFHRTQGTNFETPATQFSQGLRRRVNQNLIKLTTKTNIVMMRNKHWKILHGRMILISIKVYPKT